MDVNDVLNLQVTQFARSIRKATAQKHSVVVLFDPDNGNPPTMYAGISSPGENPQEELMATFAGMAQFLQGLANSLESGITVRLMSADGDEIDLPGTVLTKVITNK